MNNFFFYDRSDFGSSKIEERLRYFSKKLNYQFIKRRYINFSLFFKKSNIQLTDHINLFNTLIVIILILFKRISKLTVHSFEMYFIDLNSLIKEFIKSSDKRYFFFIKDFLKVSILLLIIRYSRCNIIFCNNLRRLFWLKKYKKYKNNTYVLSNKILSKFFSYQLNKKIVSNFLFIAGNIGSESDLKKIIYFCKKNNYKIICTNLTKNTALYTQNKNIIILKKKMNAKEIFLYSKKSSANICLYNSNTPNQKYAASMKLYESMTMNKLIIISNNLSLKRTLKEENYKKYYFVSQLDSIVKLHRTKFEINKKLFLEEEVGIFLKKYISL